MNNLKSFKLFSRFLKVVLPYRKRYLAMLILNGLIALLGLVNPYLTKLVVDDALMKRNLRLLLILTSIGAGIFILNGAIDGIRQFLERYVRLRINFDLNKIVFRHIQHFPLVGFRANLPESISTKSTTI